MKLKIVFAIVGLVLLGGKQLFAQSYAEEALFLSRIRPGGTARIQAMGGVQNSLGGDLSTAYYNPAGLGMYNKSEFSFTLGYTADNTSSSYMGNTDPLSSTKIIIPNLGIAFHSKKNDGGKGLLGGTFAVNFNRINDFNSSYTYHGKNTDSSIIDYFIGNANGSDISQFNSNGYNYNTITGLAYNNYLIGPANELDAANPADQYYTYVYPFLPTQTETVVTSGAQNQWSFSYGVNLSDKIFLGGGIGVATIKYKSTKTYKETFNDPYTFSDGHSEISPMSELDMVENLSLSGTGINATIGAIIRPVDVFQFGLSIATPTNYSISESYNATMSTNWNNFQYDANTLLTQQNAHTDIVTSDYFLTTPWRFTGGGTFFIQKKGFISVDAEWVDYSHPSYSDNNTGIGYADDNNQIKSLYKSVLNIRAGGEYRINSYRVRAGYSIMPDPYKTQQNGIDQTNSFYSVGGGYRTSSFYIDLALVLGQYKAPYQPYTIQTAPSPLVSLNRNNTNVTVTVGFPF